MSNPANIRAHHSLLEHPSLQPSLDHALLQYQMVLTAESRDGNGAAAAHYKVAGVLEFLHQFKYLVESATPQRQKVQDQLDYQA